MPEPRRPVRHPTPATLRQVADLLDHHWKGPDADEFRAWLRQLADEQDDSVEARLAALAESVEAAHAALADSLIGAVRRVFAESAYAPDAPRDGAEVTGELVAGPRPHIAIPAADFPGDLVPDLVAAGVTVTTAHADVVRLTLTAQEAHRGGQ